jgi:Xaa-Pro aminopeptidase
MPLDRAGLSERGKRASLAGLVKESGFRRVGYQRDHLSIGDHLLMAEAGVALEDAGYVLRRWQDRRAGDDLVYFVLAGNAVLHGIAAARKFFHRNEGAMTERDLVAVYHQAVRRFAAKYGFQERVFSYFDIVHSGGRTFLPATAGDYPVTPADRTIKFDMGLVVADAFGCIRGCSDIARTICRDPELEAIHDRLRAILVEELIPSIRPGMSGQEIHAVGVEKLRPLEGELRRLGLLPEGKGVDGYVRDCGHTIQRQTISAVYFLPGVTEQVENGMLGCTEYVWPIGDVLIAVEDGYFVTEEGAIPFTADVEP